jgi:glycosyltransferase involved in cell wall biosynthesis
VRGADAVSRALVSIILPAYNAEHFVGRALRSALEQTHRDLEIIVVDDGSIDGTATVIRGYRDPRIRYLYQPNRGQGPARNNGLRLSTGTYITFLDADDFYLATKVERQVALLEAHPEFGAAFCNAVHFYTGSPDRLFSRPARVTSGDIFPSLLRSSLVNPNTLMVRANVLKPNYFFCEERYYPEEWDLCLRLSRAGVQFGYADEDLVVVEIRENSNTTMEIQWILKKNAVGMLERLFAGMTDADRARFRADQVLRRSRAKLAAAYLVAGNKPAFRQIVSQTLPGSVAPIIGAAVSLVPTGIVRRAAVRLWRWRTFRSFSRRMTSGERSCAGA